jgi:hypothetical protein
MPAAVRSKSRSTIYTGAARLVEPECHFYSLMYLIEIFLPLCDNRGAPFAPGDFAEIRSALTEKFGGLTAFSRAPADGTEKESGRERHDELIVFEIMTDTLERDWWSSYRQSLERKFRQDRILIRVSEVTLL